MQTRLPDGRGSSPLTRSYDERSRTVSMVGSRTDASDTWLVYFAPSDGSPADFIRVTRGSGPLGMGVTDATADLFVQGQGCTVRGPGVQVTEWVADPTTGRPSVMAVDLTGTCWIGARQALTLDGHLRWHSSLPYGGLQLAGSKIDLGGTSLGEASLPVTTTIGYVGPGTSVVGRVEVAPYADPFPGNVQDDFRVDAESCTGVRLTDASQCQVTVSARRRALWAMDGRITVFSPEGRVLSETVVAFLPSVGTGSGGLIPQQERAADTRSGRGSTPPKQVPAHGILAFSATDGHAYPPVVARGTSMVNLAVVSPTSNGYLAALAPGSSTATTSSLNFVAGQTTSNLVLAPVDSAGVVHVLNASDRPVDVVADLEGFIPTMENCTLGPPRCGYRLHPAPPSRILDTRTAAGGARPLAVGTTDLSGSLPAFSGGAQALLATVTVVSPKAPGWVRVGNPFGVGSSVNFLAGRTTSNTVLARVALSGPTRGGVSVTVGGLPVHVVIDVVGVVDDGYEPTGVALVPVAGGPTRVADSRRGLGLATLAGGRAGTLTIPAALRGPDTVGVVHNLTAIASHATWLTAYPTGTPRPLSSVLYVAAPGARAGTALTMTSPAGALDIYSIAGPTDVVSDVAARVDLWPSTDRLRGFPRLPVGVGAMGPAVRSR